MLRLRHHKKKIETKTTSHHLPKIIIMKSIRIRKTLLLLYFYTRYAAIALTSPISWSFDHLSTELGGRGRAKVIWEAYRRGEDPLQSTDAGERLKSKLNRIGGSTPPVSLVQQNVAKDGTTKLLVRLDADGLEVETVIIPWHDLQKSTLCVSSQVGCAQACTFCETGRMGKLRSLQADEILGQLWTATRLCNDNGIYPIDNIVFMGMGEAGDNVDNVLQACQVMTDPLQFQLAPRRVTISTVGPSPDTFLKLAEAPAVIAWSVHASKEATRKLLVPTTRYSMEDLRDRGLVEALHRRSRRLRSTMLEVTLIDGINDSVDDALHLAQFCQPILQVPGVKLVVNLIPWNDIQAPFGPAALYRKPSRKQVDLYQATLIENGIKCFIRTTRGDDESAACGQLATGKRKKEVVS